ncbi:hypothetical protein CASFOL_024711 [Castilleja foliolosa]|uniref:Uncharacterized protein n=1 Tax=Castilleja foliolosa TaxID=1961234 RepID=A0ABD3CT25_9LAMI
MPILVDSYVMFVLKWGRISGGTAATHVTSMFTWIVL